METLSFAFGALSMIGLLTVITIVAGAVKVIKHGRQIEDLSRNINEQIEDLSRNINERFEFTVQHTYDMEKNMYDSINSQITDAVTQCNSYTDKRIDKFIDSKKLLTEENKK